MSATGFEEAFAKVQPLVDGFHENEDRYLAAGYSELDVRLGFIDPFFTALGWPVHPDPRTNPYEREVRLGFEVEVGAAHKFADYAFFIAPNFHKPRFFSEAKKPQNDLANSGDYFQTVRYGANGKTPVAVLTDFKHFEMLDSRFTPDIKTILGRRIRQYHYMDYADQEKFGEIYWLFSREAVAGGSLEKFADTLPTRGKQIPPPHLRNIDDAFLDELEKFRSDLARAFKKFNPALASATLTEATQRTLDRLVFMRFLEDRLIEPKPVFSKFASKDDAWTEFVTECRRLNGIYNGIVFRNHPLLDSSRFRIDNDTFSAICLKLVDRYTPYDFNSIPIHILGSIYERFLGKVIVATDKRVRVEEKPEVRKAGGVYYTPEYIVRYIVENTVGKLIAGKTPDQISEMHFADIACGSGSFLLGVFDLLLAHHGNYYNRNPAKARKGDCIERDGALHLSLRKKREILLHNIYGMDIDNQAVEVTQLSLYLKLLKEETTSSAHDYQLEFHETLLPTLKDNIVCGNSLIGADFSLVLEERHRVNAMDLFPEIVKCGGFDAVVGNPPWVFTRDVDFGRFAKDYFASHYVGAAGKVNLYALFLDRGIQILRKNGLVSLILPNTFLRATTYEKLRRHLMTKHKLVAVTDAGPDVFAGVTASTVVLLVQKDGVASSASVLSISKEGVAQKINTVDITQIAKTPSAVVDIFTDTNSRQVILKMAKSARPLADFVEHLISGIQTWKQHKSNFISDTKLSDKYKPLLEGKDIGRYESHFANKYIFYSANVLNVMQDENIFLLPDKILIQRISGGSRPLKATLDRKRHYCFNSINTLICHGFDNRYVLGLLNSTLLSWYYYNCFSNRSELTVNIATKLLRQLPIPALDLSDPSGKARHDQMVQLVEQMLEAKKEFTKAKMDSDRDYYKRQCDGLDRQIDALVYELYGLTADEMNTVETALKER